MANLAMAFWLLAAMLPCLTLALQVTPGSPCADFCIDEKTLDQSDPKSSNTDGDDIVCNDFEFSSDNAGKKFQRCMTCLQGSDFVKGSESDLDWFLCTSCRRFTHQFRSDLETKQCTDTTMFFIISLDNLRYSFDYCVFGDMQASDVDSNPCATSEGCGRLTDALRDDMINSTDRSQYGYCEADHQAIHGEGFDKCLSCVSAEATHSYISNCKKQYPDPTKRRASSDIASYV
jgi:hypothetical protein